MEFQKSKVYTALNADELKIGSKVIVANSIGNLKELVEQNMAELSDLSRINNIYSDRRFVVNEDTDRTEDFAFAYLVSVPEEKNWIVYVCRKYPNKHYLTACREDAWEGAQKNGAKTKLFEGTEKETTDWYEARKQFTDIIAAWEDGKTIQYNSGYGWEDCCNNRPAWDITSQYRIKQEGLKWTDLKIGDIIRNGEDTFMIIGIDTDGVYDCHILAGDRWLKDTELESWEKVEE